MAAMDFGEQEVSTPAEKPLQITNGSKAVSDLKFTIIQGTDRCTKDNYGNDLPLDFRIVPSDTPCSSSLKASANCTVKIQFSPCQAGELSGAALEITGNVDHQSFSVQVGLRGIGQVLNLAHIENTSGQSSSPITRAVVGIDASGASSAATQQKLFVEFDLNAPVGKASHKDPLERRFWLFVNPRITSVPQPASSISGLDVQGDFLSTALQQQKTTDIVQGLDVLSGVEYFLTKPREGVPFWSEYKNTHAKLAAALVAGLGFTTPFTSPSNSAQEIDLTSTPSQNVKANFPDLFDKSGNSLIPSGKTILALVAKDRSRFFRKYYAGLRLKTYFFSSRANGECDDEKPKKDKKQGRCEALASRFPGIIDITAGQDESLTGGKLSHWVFRLDAVYPLPFSPAFHIFGSVLSAFEKNSSTLPLLAAGTTKPLTDSSVFIHAVGPPDRDIYRIGVGVDLVQLLRKKKTPGSQNQAAPATGTTPAATATKNSTTPPPK